MTDNTPQEVPPSRPNPSQPTAYAAYLPYVPPAPAAFAAPVPAYPPASTTLSISSFVLGLVSIIFGFIVFVPLVGLVLGIRAVKKEPAARGFAIAGIWINAVMLGLVVIAIVIVMLLLVLGPSMAGLFTDASNTIPGTPA